MIKHCIFDFDGVLVDSMPTWAGTYVKLLREAGITPPHDMVTAITPLGNEGAAKYCISHGLPLSLDEVKKKVFDIYLYEYLNVIPAKHNVPEMLRYLRERGFELHVLTASSHAYVDGCLERAGVLDLFRNVWSTDDFGLPKSNTEIYARAAELIGAKLHECAFFDDNIIALTTAKRAGMYAVGVYDASSDSLVDEMKAVGDKYIYNFEDIKEFL